MKIIPVKIPGKKASLKCLVDDWEFNYLSQYKWHLRSGRPAASIGGVTIAMHRIILWCPKDLQIDHKDRDPMNNQKSNLRLCRPYQNMGNREKLVTNKSGLRGVHKTNGHRSKPWQSRITVNGRRYWLGHFDTPEEASEAYKKASTELLGEFANLE